jgi:hypothetical protein
MRAIRRSLCMSVTLAAVWTNLTAHAAPLEPRASFERCREALSTQAGTELITPLLPGERLILKIRSQKDREVFYLGNAHDYLHFWEAKARWPSPILIVQKDHVSEYERYQSLVIRRERGNWMSLPQALMAVLENKLHAEEPLPPRLRDSLMKDSAAIYRELVENLSSKNILKELSRFAPGRAPQPRDLQHERILKIFDRHGLKVTKTDSISALIDQLRSGQPAVISAWAQMAPLEIHHLTFSGNPRLPEIPEFIRTQGQIPNPAASILGLPNGFAPAYAFAILPAHNLSMSLLIVVYDSFTDTIGVWPANRLQPVRANRYFLFHSAAETLN